jgi:carnitine-CoA ligase
MTVPDTTADVRVIGTLLDHWTATRPNHRFVTVGQESYSFAEISARAHAVASGFSALGIGRGDRVAIISPNRIEMIDLYFGLAKLGAIQVPLNAFLKGEFLRYQLVDSQAAAIVADSDALDAVIPLLDELPDLRVLVTMDTAALIHRPGVTQAAFDRALLESTERVDLPQIERSDPMSIVYTSGTTGLPKGCILTHGYYTRVGQIVDRVLDINANDSIYTTLPLFHAGGRLLTVGAALQRGIPVIVDATFSPKTILRRCRDVGATVIVGLGVMGTAMLSLPPRPEDTDHQVHTMWMVPMTPADQERFQQRFGIDPYAEAFGQTECAPVLASHRNGVRNRASAGTPAPDLQVALLDGSGHPVPDGEVGEICLRPEDCLSMFSGYWNKPEATLQQFSGLWYHTGDNGRRLPDGTIAFSDRKKDSLRRRGENVSSMELEAAILTHPQISEAAVHAAPSDLGEDDIKACLVTTEAERPSPEALFAFLSNNLPYFAIPRYVEYVESLPRNAVGRVMKHQLREVAMHEGVIDFSALGLEVARDERRSAVTR